MIIGIDPGASGGIAFHRGGDGAWAMKMPEHENELREALWLYRAEIERVYIERVHAMPKQGVSSTFKFGFNFGIICGVVAGLELSREFVRPADWQRALGCLTRGDKNVSKAKALELFPSLKATHATADALLIMEYGRRKEAGLIR